MSGAGLAVISDAHLGDPFSWLHRAEVQDRVVSFLAEASDVDTLVLLGDALDLNYGTLSGGLEGYQGWPPAPGYSPGLRRLLAGICAGTQIEHVIYVPGNHDFMVWEWEARQRHVLDRLAAGIPIGGPLKTDGEFPRHFLRGVMPAARQDSFTLKYPYHTALVGEHTVVLTHGHYLDAFQSGGVRLAGLAQASDPTGFMQEFYKACAQWQEVAHANGVRRRTREGVHRLLGGVGNALDKLRSARGRAPSKEDLREMNVFLHCVAGEPAATAFVYGHTHVPGHWRTPRSNGWAAAEVFNAGAFTPVHGRDASLLVLRPKGGKLEVTLRCVNQAGQDTSRPEDRWEVSHPVDCARKERSMESLSVPVVIDDVKRDTGFRMSRCTYFTLQGEDIVGDPALRMEVGRIPLLTLDLTGIIYASLSGGEFSDWREIEDLLTAVEEDGRLQVRLADIWLPNEQLARAKGEGDLARGDVFRLDCGLFLLAHRHREELLSLSEFRERCAVRGEEIRYSAQESASFREWSLRQVAEAREGYPKSEGLALAWDDSRDRGRGGVR